MDIENVKSRNAKKIYCLLYIAEKSVRFYYLCILCSRFACFSPEITNTVEVHCVEPFSIHAGFAEHTRVKTRLSSNNIEMTSAFVASIWDEKNLRSQKLYKYENWNTLF